MAAAEQTVTVRIQGDAETFMRAAPVTDPPRRTRRDQVYDMLREAGAEGVTLADIAEHVPFPGIHIESLRYEEHGIRELSGKNEQTGRWERRWVLERDAWAA